MSWFIFALIALLSWGCADLFYKKGSDTNDGLSHLKIAVMVGLVMGLFSAFFLLLPTLDGLWQNLPNGAYEAIKHLYPESDFSFINLLKYSPASFSYIISMIIGYAGMRYLELSIVSPVQNSSGALSAVCMIIYFTAVGKISSIKDEFDILSIIGTLLIVIGLIALAVVEKRLDKKIEPTDKKYKMGALALIFPLLYCLFDTIGTAADGVILDDSTGLGLGEIDVLVAYGITFFIVGVFCYLYMLIVKKTVFNPFSSKSKGVAALFEMFGQIFYVYAMASNPVLSAPMIGSYCIVSVILSRIFLKEKLTRKQYVTIFIVIAGIVLMGISEGIGEM